MLQRARLRWYLDAGNCEAPLLAFGNRKATGVIRIDNPKWVEEDAGGY